MDFHEMVQTWAHFHYDWLPAYEAVPKVIGAQLVPHQLQSLEVNFSTFSFIFIIKLLIG